MIVIEVPLALQPGQVTRVTLAEEAAFLGCDFRVGGTMIKLAGEPSAAAPKFYLRVLLDEKAPRETNYYFVAVASGQEFRAIDGMEYIGTGAIIVSEDKTLVAHLFQLPADQVEPDGGESANVVH